MKTKLYTRLMARACPRCLGDMWQPYVALSRLDNETDVCSQCGYEEAMEQYFHGEVKNWKKEK